MKTKSFLPGALKVLNIGANETFPVLYMFLLSFFMGFTVAVYTAAAGTQFLTYFDAEFLPVMYIISGLCCSLFSIGYTLLEKRISVPKLVSVLLIIFINIQLIFRIMLYFPIKPVIGALFISKDIMILFFAFIFYRLMNTVFTIRQNKRLYGISSSGEIVAGIFGGLLVSLVVPFVGSGNLLVISAVATVLVLLIFRLLLPSLEKKESSLEEKVPYRAGRGDTISLPERISGLFYPGFIFIFSALLGLGYFFFENLFYFHAQWQFLEETSLASFIGLTTAILCLLTFSGKIILSDRVVIHYGIRLPLIILPAAGAVFLLLYKGAGLLQSTKVILFGITTFSFIGYTFLKDTLSQSGMMVLYQPFPALQRHRMQIAIARSGSFLASICFFVIASLSNSKYPTIAYFIFLLCILAACLAYFLHRAYKNELKKALAERNFTSEALALDHAAGKAVLENALLSEDPGEIIYALMVTERIYSADLDTFIISLLKHSNEIVRQKAVSLIEKQHIRAALPDIKKLLTSEKSVHVLGSAVGCAAALGKASMIEAVVPFLQHKKGYVKKRAIAGLIRYCGIEGTLIAGTRLLKMIDSANPATRLAAAAILRDIGITNFYQPLEKLLVDENMHVRKEALRAAAKLKSKPLFPLVINNLSIPELTGGAVGALKNRGSDCLILLENEYNKEGQTRAVKKAVMTIYGSSTGELPVELLLKKLTEPNRELVHEAVISLKNLQFTADVSSSDIIDTTLTEEVQRAAWLQKTLDNLSDFEQVQEKGILLKSALEDELTISKQTILYLLSFIKSSGTVIMAQEKLFSARGEKQMYALELFDTTLPPSLRPQIMALFDNTVKSSHGREDQAKAADLHLLLEQVIKKIITWDHPAILGGALFFSSFLSPSLPKELLLEIALSEKYPVYVIESALYALNKLYPALLRKHKDTFVNHKDKNISMYIMDKTSSFKSESVKYITIEKADYLKKTMLFSGTKVELLLTITPYLSEHYYEKNKIPVNEGAAGTSLYILTGGKVRLYNSKGSRNEILGPSDVFGELSMLSTGARDYSVKTEENTSLFSLEKDRFFSLLAEGEEILTSVLHVLCTRLLSLTDRREDVQNIHYNTVEKEFKQEKKELILPVEKMLLLQKLPYFKDLSHRTLYKLALICRDITAGPDHKLIRAGTKYDELALSIIYSGSVLLKEEDFQVKLYKGSFFGELHMFAGRDFPADVTCLEKTHVLILERSRLLHFMKEHNSAARSFLAGLASSIKKMR